MYPENVFYQSIKGAAFKGALRNKHNDVCLQVVGTTVLVRRCALKHLRIENQQDFYLNPAGEIRVGTEIENCVASSRLRSGGRYSKNSLSNALCHGYGTDQKWSYSMGLDRPQARPLQVRSEASTLCLDAKLILAPCAHDGDRLKQQEWIWEENPQWE